MLYVLLPAYNEADALETLIPSIGQTLAPLGPYRIVLADDGSTDSTPGRVKAWAASWPVDHLRHEPNQGYGAALKLGYAWILDRAASEDIVVSLDADNTHRPEYIPLLAEKIAQGYDVVTASYWAAGGHMYGVPMKRRIMSHTVNLLFRWLLRIPNARCYTNGFRAYRAAALQKTQAHFGERFLEENGFPGGTELFIKVCRLGGKAGEIPFDLHYENRGKGSKIHLRKTILGYLRLLKAVLQ